MSENVEWTTADQIGADLIAHKVLFHALTTTLLERGLLTLEDIDKIFDDAASGLEKADLAEPSPILREARASLERTSRNRRRRA